MGQFGSVPAILRHNFSGSSAFTTCGGGVPEWMSTTWPPKFELAPPFSPAWRSTAVLNSACHSHCSSASYSSFRLNWLACSRASCSCHCPCSCNMVKWWLPTSPHATPFKYLDHGSHYYQSWLFMTVIASFTNIAWTGNQVSSGIHNLLWIASTGTAI